MQQTIFMVFNDNVQKKNVFIIAMSFMCSGFIVAWLYHSAFIPYDRVSWLFWLTSIGLFLFSIYRKKEQNEQQTRVLVLLIIGITILYFVTHLWNYPIAPWNSNGLFDDAAWDLYFVKQQISGSASIQLIFNDTEVGRIGRELIFHHFISIWFQLFGYNLFSFNLALVFLGYITVLFTALLAYRIFGSVLYAALTAVMMNFYPLHFTQVFMGHRYAICAPLMMISLYFLYAGYQSRSVFRISLGGVFAALCMQSAIMGKQYIFALIGSVILLFVFSFWHKKDALKSHMPLAVAAAVAFLIALMPLLAYLMVNYGMYTARERSLMREMIIRVQTEGLTPLWDNIALCCQTLFAPYSSQRQFMQQFPIIQLTWLPLVLAGLAVSFARKHYFVLLMIAIPISGTFVAISYDFRLLIAAPFLILSIIFALHSAASMIRQKKLAAAAVCIVTILLIISPVRYLFALSSDPQGQYLLPHPSVAASRFIQDIVVGAEQPDFQMKPDEFNRRNNNAAYDTLAGTKHSYAHVHAYLHDYDASMILSLLDHFPYQGRDPQTLNGFFTEAILNYQVTQKDLMLVLETGSEISEIISVLSDFVPGEKTEYNGQVDGQMINMLTMRIDSSEIEDFKRYIAQAFAAPASQRSG